jgi:hypothetical protein
MCLFLSPFGLRVSSALAFRTVGGEPLLPGEKPTELGDEMRNPVCAYRRERDDQERHEHEHEEALNAESLGIWGEPRKQVEHVDK